MAEPGDGIREWAKVSARAAVVAAAAAVWQRVDPARPHPMVDSIAPGDNVQRPMNLVMPLKYRYLARRGDLAKGLATAVDQLLVGLNNVGTVHFARFDLVAGNLCMFSIYDGELSGYIRDFINVIGQAFDVLMGFVADPPPTPVSEHPDEFVAWIAAHDAFQLPEEPTDLRPDLRAVERETLLVLRQHPNVQFGVYRAYPGYSAAQVRQSLGVGW
ncbi:MAG: hypothetical protein ACR2HV_08530 [Acidimicrobiales bacterium]